MLTVEGQLVGRRGLLSVERAKEPIAERKGVTPSWNGAKFGGKKASLSAMEQSDWVVPKCRRDDATPTAAKFRQIEL